MLMFQYWTGTSPDLEYVANYYVDVHLSPAQPFLTATQCTPEKDNCSFLFYVSLSERLSPTLDHLLT